MSSDHRVLYTQRDFPVLQNRMYDTPEAARCCPQGDIELVEDLQTGLVYNRRFDSTLVNYDEAYQSDAGVSLSFHTHLLRARDTILEHLKGGGGRTLVEIGCGNGRFLNLLADEGVDIRGFDPACEIEDARIEKRLFGADTQIQASGLVLRHVLEHVADPVAFLRTLAEANGGRGFVYIEVPCFDWICTNRVWFDINYEHVNYFRLSDFDGMFGHVYEAGHCFNGQFLYVLGDLASLRSPVYDADNAVDFPAGFIAKMPPGTTGAEDIIWGAGSKGVVYALFRMRAGVPVKGVIDINPAKQGKYLATTGLRVHSPQELLPQLRPDARILVMNPNYEQEIVQMSDHIFTYIEI